MSIRSWPKASREAAEEMVSKHGPPDEITDWRCVWHWRLPWKRIEVVRNGYPHMWPRPHMDVVTQTVPYRVPPESFSALTFYDGSVFAERTAGELSARCGGEKMNYVALNLAHDVITGRRSVEQARREYERLAIAVAHGEAPPYASALQFTPMYGRGADPDVQTLPTAGLGQERAMTEPPSAGWLILGVGIVMLAAGYLSRGR